MKYQVIGIEEVNFKTKEGDSINGTRLHLAFDKPSINGMGVEAVFVKESIDTDDIVIGDIIELYYNKFGKVADVVKI